MHLIPSHVWLFMKACRVYSVVDKVIGSADWLIRVLILQQSICCRANAQSLMHNINVRRIKSWPLNITESTTLTI